MNKEQRWRTYLIDKAVQATERIAHTEETSMEDDVRMVKGGLIISLLESLNTIKLVNEMITELDNRNILDTESAYRDWSKMCDRNNEIMDVAYRVAETMFSQQVIQDYKDRFELHDLPQELHGE